MAVGPHELVGDRLPSAATRPTVAFRRAHVARDDLSEALRGASPIGVYAREPKDRLVDEAWPATVIPSSTCSVQKR